MISKVTKSDYQGISIDKYVSNNKEDLTKVFSNNVDTNHYTISHDLLLDLELSKRQEIIQVLQNIPQNITIINAKSAPIYVCIHGFGGSEKSFDLLKKELRSTGYLAIFYTLSLKGHDHNLEEQESNYFSMSQRTSSELIAHTKEKVVHLLKAKHIETCTIIGHSMGGVVAAALANDVDLKSSIGKVICFNPAFYKPVLPTFKMLSKIDTYSRSKPNNTKRFLRISQHILNSQRAEKISKSLLHYFVKRKLHNYYGDKRNPNIDYFFHAYYQQATDPNFLKAFYAIAVNLFREDTIRIDNILKSIDRPVHIFHGEKDKRFHWEKIKELCNHLHNGFFEVLQGLGHNPHEEEPAMIAQKILNIAQANYSKEVP